MAVGAQDLHLSNFQPAGMLTNPALTGCMPASYQLIDQTGFPPKPLTDAAATLEQAGLINGVLSQKL